MAGTFDTLAAAALIAGLGYLAVWRGLLGESQVDGIRRFVFYFCLPAIVLGALVDMPVEEVLRLDYLAVFGVGSLATFLVVLLVALVIRRAALTRAAMMAMGASVPNSGFLGYPIALVVLGPEVATVALALNFAVENLVLIPLGLMLAEAGGQRGVRPIAAARAIFQGLVRNPIVIAILAGTAIILVGLPVPRPATLALDVLRGAAAPTALFVVGATLATTRAGDLNADTVIVTLCKLLVHPLLVALALTVLGISSSELAAAAILFASMPMVTIYPILARPYGLDRAAAAAMLLATALGFFTLYGVVQTL